jgi:bacterioferritin-associated ferredoxin
MPLKQISSTVRDLAERGLTVRRFLPLVGRQQPVAVVEDGRTGLVCHCRRVEYRTVREAIGVGARTISDLQRTTTACTRCFGCRAELERILRLHLGAAYRHEASVTLPPEFARTRPIRPMYMPVLAGFHGSPVDTRVIVFNWEGPDEPIPFRADLVRADGTRVHVWYHEVANGCSAVVDLSRDVVAELLPEGVGAVKLVIDTPEVGSLRPYFQFVTPSTVTSTHEKKGPPDPNRRRDRKYHWVFPIGVGERREEAYFFATNPYMEPMTGELVWTSDDGEVTLCPVPTLEFDQTACVPLHEHFPVIATGAKGGSVHLAPATHAIAGFMIRHDPERQLWRVQHL